MNTVFAAIVVMTTLSTGHTTSFIDDVNVTKSLEECQASNMFAKRAFEETYPDVKIEFRCAELLSSSTIQS